MCRKGTVEVVAAVPRWAVENAVAVDAAGAVLYCAAESAVECPKKSSPTWKRSGPK